MAIYAFDFDGTLSDTQIQSLAKKLKKQGNEIWVVTARSDNEYNRTILKAVLDKLFIPFANVIFCGNKPKAEMLQMINADVYIDNISDEFETIKNHTNTIPLLWQ